MPRAHLDQYLLSNGIVKDYKEILLFTSGVLSGKEIPRNGDIKKSEFMKIVYKSVMRKSVLNIIKFTKIGGDVSGGSVTFSTGIQRLQRQILYWGIVTKNTAATGPLTSKQREEGMSDSCKDIITSLQGLKQDKRISEEKCQIMIEELSDWRAKNHDRLAMKYGVLTEFGVEARYVLGKPDPNFASFVAKFDHKK